MPASARPTRRLSNPALSRAGAAISGAALLCLLSGCASSGPTADATPPRPDEISGRYIAVMCDADMTWSAFADGTLGAREPGAADSVTVVSLPIAPPPGEDASRWKTSVAQVAVSNSAMGPPVSLAVSRDGRRAFACETRGPAPEGATRLDELPPGAFVTALDLTDPAAPVVLGKLKVDFQPTGCDVHPAGDLVLVATQRPGEQIVLIPVDPTGQMSKPLTFELVGAGEKARPTCVQWSPGGTHFAVSLPDTNQVAFYEFRREIESGVPGVAPWGEPVTVGKYPASGRFTPDGRFYVTTELQWGPDVERFMAGAPEGRLSVIRLSDKPSAVNDAGELDNSSVVHTVVSTASVGVSPESMAMSPDGRWIVTANLRGSYLAEGDARATRGGSLSLVSLARDGQATTRAETPLKAMPQGVAFDASGRHLVVSEFRTFEPGALSGELAFFKLVAGDQPTLVPAKFYVGVGPGPHGVLIVR